MHPLRIGALAATCCLWPPNARAQAGSELAAPCPQRWIYEPPPTTAYVGPPFINDSAGDFFWREEAGHPELVAVRDGRTRWRRQLGKRSTPLPVNAALMRDDLLVVALGSTVEGRRTANGRIVWSRDLRADLSRDLRRAGLAKNTELETSAAARLGRALVTATAAGYSGAWLTATASDGKLVWRTRIDRAGARMVAAGDRLYVLPSLGEIGKPSIIAVDGNGKEIVEPRVPFRDSMAVSGGEVVFDQDYVVTARIAPISRHCPPNSPSCGPSPFFLTVTGLSAGQERWSRSHAVGDTRVLGLLLLSDRSVLLVDNQRVGRISPDGRLTQLCELPVDERGSVAGLIHGDLVVAYHRSVGAYTLPGAPQLAATGWVMHGGGPAQDWTARAAGATTRFVPFPAGVADPDANVAYVQTDSGATAALALADGTVLWHTPRPARPVGIWNGRVIVLEHDALASTLQLGLLDPASGAEVEVSQPIPLPNLVPIRLAPWGEPLMTDVRIAGDRAHLAWEIVINGGSGGADIKPYGASGAADVDLRSGAVSLSPTTRVEEGRPVSRLQGPLAAVVGGRRLTLLYAATATLTATDVKSGKTSWARQLWSIAVPERVQVPPP